MRMDPISAKTGRERLEPCESRALVEAAARFGTVVRTGDLYARPDERKSGIPATARHRTDDPAIGREVAEYRRLGALFSCTPGWVKIASMRRNWSSVSLPPWSCLLYTSPSPRDGLLSRMPSSA